VRNSTAAAPYLCNAQRTQPLSLLGQDMPTGLSLQFAGSNDGQICQRAAGSACTWEQALHVERLAKRCAGALVHDRSRKALGVIKIRQHGQSAQHLQVDTSQDMSAQPGLTR
jgi:hypothetical protein